MALRAVDVLNGDMAVSAREDIQPGGHGRNILANDMACRGYHVRLRLDRAGAIAERLAFDATRDMVAHRHACECGVRHCVNGTAPESTEKIILNPFLPVRSNDLALLN